MNNSISQHPSNSEENLYFEMYNEMPAICILIDQKLNIKSINHYGCKQLGYSPKELIDSSVIGLYREDEQQFITLNLNSLFDNKNQHTIRWECTNVRKDKSHLWVKDTAKYLTLNHNKDRYVLLVSEDITETRYLINELEKQVSSDALTGLINRHKFERHIDQSILSTQTIHKEHVLCFINLDRFNIINDVSGHLAGDELLKQVSRIIQSMIRSEDVLARIGGDEFGLLFINSNATKANQKLKDIIFEISQFHLHWENEIFNITASAGFITINHASGNATECIQKASTACHLAKNKGRNNVHQYNPSDSEQLQHDKMHKNLSLLNWAFENNQLELHYQEVHPISSFGRQQHLEILIRLRDKNNELVYPDSFIPAAEYYGLATQLDLWVTETALSHFSQIARSQEIVCNINLSGKTLGSNEFIEKATKLLDQYQTPNITICFEVTETCAISNITKAVEFINHFKNLGCQFALDDFGSGFSSFAYLKSLPVDYLKIDGYFVKNIMKDPKDLALVRAIHQVAEIFEIQTIAEFVEDEAILTVLKGIGIDYGQGYHLHKPEKL